MGHKDLKIPDFKECRRYAVQFLYQCDALQTNWFEHRSFEGFCNQAQVPFPLRPFLLSLCETSLRDQQKADLLIQKHARNWKLNRLGRVDLSILRVGTCEIEKRTDTDYQAIVNDCVEIGKTFGSEHTGSFINGVLDAIGRELRQLPAKDKSHRKPSGPTSGSQS